MKMNIEKTSELLSLRGKLQAISDISYSFSILNRQNPINQLSESNTQSLIDAYHELIIKVGAIYSEYENEKKETK